MAAAAAMVLSDTSDTASEGTCFKASSGWLAKFKARHGICKLSCEGESLSANSDDIEPLKIRLSSIIEEGYTMHQLFNCDETGKCYKIQLLLMVVKRVQGVSKYLKSELLFLPLLML